MHHPGDSWLYNTGSDVLGVLIARVAGRPFAEFLAERIFKPLGMRDTGFHVPATDLHRFTTAYRPDGSQLAVTDPPEGQWSAPPAFCSGSGGLVSTLDDLLAFQRMLLAGGAGVLSPEAVALMTTDHLTSAQRTASTVFLDGQGWGSAAASTSSGSRRGTCPAVTAGSAAPARPRTSTPWAKASRCS